MDAVGVIILLVVPLCIAIHIIGTEFTYNKLSVWLKCRYYRGKKPKVNRLVRIFCAEWQASNKKPRKYYSDMDIDIELAEGRLKLYIITKTLCNFGYDDGEVIVKLSEAEMYFLMYFLLFGEYPYSPVEGE